MAMCTDPAEYDATSIYNACNGWSADKDAIGEVLFTRTQEEIQEVRAAYHQLYGQDMLNTIRDDTSGELEQVYENIITSAGQADRQPETEADIQADVREPLK